MKYFCRTAPLMVLLMALAGCQPTQHIGPTGAPNGTVMHVVIMWMYDPSDETGRNELLAAGRKLESISGVVGVSGGTMLRSDLPVVDSSYDLAFIVTFRNADDLHRYLENPKHLELKKTVLDRYVKKYQVYDFVSQ